MLLVTSDTNTPASPPLPPRPKYQVFLSSTFTDLVDERNAVAWEILKAGHIPTGMENFSALDERGWEIIQETIDESDYYVLIIAGRYGTIDQKTGLSWTEMEYDYATKLGVPVLAFIRTKDATPGDRMDTDRKRVQKLAAFVDKVGNAHMREMWTNDEDLSGKVALALLKTIQRDERKGRPRPGWYRGNRLPLTAATEGLARLSTENRDLRQQLEVIQQESKQRLPAVELTHVSLDAYSWKTHVGWNLRIWVHIAPRSRERVTFQMHKCVIRLQSSMTHGELVYKPGSYSTRSADDHEKSTLILCTANQIVVDGPGTVVIEGQVKSPAGTDTAVYVSQEWEMSMTIVPALFNETIQISSRLKPLVGARGPSWQFDGTEP